MALAENQLALSERNIWLRRLGLGGIVVLLIAGAIYSLVSMGKHPAKKREMAKVTLIDREPPPPPPPKPEKEIPKPQAKDVKVNQAKPVEAPPQPAPSLKMEGEGSANGVAGLASGNPTSDYKGGLLGDGQGAGGIDRATFNMYLKRLQRQIQEALVKDSRFKGSNYRVPVIVSLRDDGTLRDVVLSGSSGSPDLDELMRSELTRLIRKEPPPSGAPAGGFTVRVTNRLL